MKKTMPALFAIIVFALCFSFIPPSFSEELMPEPGTVIDKTNITKYAHLFPAEILPAFEDGFGGLIKPASIKVVDNKPKVYSMPKEFMDYSAGNKGKYSLDAEGNIVGGWQYNGLPFPDLQRDDKDFVTKFMWNQSGRYVMDDGDALNLSCMQRRGESVRWNRVNINWIWFAGRAMVPPKPVMENPSGLFYAQFLHYLAPANVKNMQTLAWRYLDLKKADEVYIYIPSLRRVLRGDTGQRAVPLQGSIVAMDDMSLFDGKIDQFTYTLVREQTVLTVPEPPFIEQPDKLEEVSFHSDYFMPVDCYVIDIVSKDPVYPQSKKRIWVDKNNYYSYYAAAWDRAGKLWKVWHQPPHQIAVNGHPPFSISDTTFGIDLQFGMTNFMYYGTKAEKINRGAVSYDDFTPPAMTKRAR